VANPDEFESEVVGMPQMQKEHIEHLRGFFGSFDWLMLVPLGFDY
jgi:hypothetical protein